MAGAGGTDTRLAGNTGPAKQFLTSVGSGGVATTPAWGALATEDIPNLDAAKITGGVLDQARINWTAPGPIGSTTPSSGAFTGLSTNAQNGYEVKPYGTGAGNTGEIRFDALNGTNYVGFKAPGVVASNVVWTLPGGDGTNGQILSTSGNGTLSWTTPSAAPVTSVAGRTGAISLAMGDLSGTLAIGSGGTGLSTTPSGGQILIGNGSGYALGTLTGGSGIAVSNGVGAITVGLATDGVTTNQIANGTITNADIQAGAGIEDTKLATITSVGKVSGNAVTGGTITAALSGNATNVTGVVQVTNGGTGLTTAPSNGQLLIGNGTGYTLGSLTAGTNITLSNGAGAITINAGSDSTKVSKAGDTMTGTLNLQANGLVAGTNQLVLASSNVGIGTTNPGAKLHVNGQLAVAIPATLAPTGTTQTVDFASGNMQIVNLASATGTVTLTLSNPVAGGSYAIQFVQGTSPIAVIWPASVLWPSGNPMALSTASGAVDLVTLFYNGTSYLAIGGQNFR